jgi:hypothetical protein
VAAGVLTVAVVLTIGRESIQSGATRTEPPPEHERSASPPAVTPGESIPVAGFTGTYLREDMGCHLIQTETGEVYELIIPDGVRLDEAGNGTWRLIDQDGGVIASEGDRLAANGRVTDSGGSFCGRTLFLEVSEFLPVADS